MAEIKYVDTKTAAIRSGMSESWLTQRRIYGGGPPYVKIGRAVRYEAEAFDRFMADRTREGTGSAQPEDDKAPKLRRKLVELELTVRSGNCLERDGILYVGDLVQRTEAEILRVPNIGRKSLDDIKERLAAWGLSLGMDTEGTWAPTRVLDFPGVHQLTRLTLTEVNDLAREDAFPKSIETYGAQCWVESDIQSWIEDQNAASR